MTFKIAITGGIGSGKSTIARMLASIASVPVIDADQIARDVVLPGGKVLKEIVEEFGNHILQENKALDRAALGRLIFTNKEHRKKLNNIMFPAVVEEVAKQFVRYEAEGKEYVIYDAPLLYDSGTDAIVDYIVLVVAPLDVRIKRLQERNHFTREEIDTRMSAQMSMEELMTKRRDFIISNKLSFNKLKTIIGAAWKDIQKKNTKATTSYQN